MTAKLVKVAKFKKRNIKKEGIIVIIYLPTKKQRNLENVGFKWEKQHPSSSSTFWSSTITSFTIQCHSRFIVKLPVSYPISSSSVTTRTWVSLHDNGVFCEADLFKLYQRSSFSLYFNFFLSFYDNGVSFGLRPFDSFFPFTRRLHTRNWFEILISTVSRG